MNFDYKMFLRNVVKPFIASRIGLVYITPLDCFMRFSKNNYKAQTPAIYAIWHGCQYGLLAIKGKERSNFNLLVSKSVDGEIITQISKAIGYPVIRGSQNREGTKALRDMLKAFKAGQNLAFTVDGPRGPIYKVKKGVIKIAQMGQVPIIPMVPYTKNKTEVKSWDKYQVPSLFAKVQVEFGDPIYVPKDINEEQVEEYRQKLEEELHRLHKLAMSKF